MLSEVFWVAFTTTITGMIIKLSSMAYKSKCKEIDCCCIKIIRDTEAEEKEEEFRITHPPLPQNDSNKNLNTI
jgi:hypothetical protein